MNGLDRFVLLFWCDLLLKPSGRHVGARRRDRRLRMNWRHEQLALQMALAAALHHSRHVGPVSHNAMRSQKTVRAGRWVRGACTTRRRSGSTHP